MLVTAGGGRVGMWRGWGRGVGTIEKKTSMPGGRVKFS